MLPRAHRLPSFEISRVTREGKRIHSHGITFIYSVGKSRFAFIVSTKVDKRAVVRNRLRRLMSESVRLIIPEISQAIDCVVIGSKQLVGKSQKEVSEIIGEVIRETVPA